MEYHQRCLEIVKEVRDKAGEGRSYGNLGNAYRALRKFKTAIEYHQRHLEIAKEVGDKVGEGRTYGNLGDIYYELRQFQTAIEYQNRSLEIAQEVGDKTGEGLNYYHLGTILRDQKKFKRAIESYQRYLEISKEVRDKTGEACSLGSLGISFGCQGDPMRAFTYFNSSVEVYDDITASLQLNDQWKISYRNQHQSAYKGLWRIILIQGKVVNALLAAEKGRAQALRDLMDTRYRPDHTLRNSGSCLSLNSVPSNTVFIALNGPCVHFWVFLCENNIQMRKVHVNNYKYEKELEFFIRLQNKTALKEIGRRDAVPCKNPSPGSPKEEKVAKDVIRVDVLTIKGSTEAS